MNTLIRRSLFAVMLVAGFLPSLLRAQAFEGTVTWETSVPMLGDKKLEMSVSMKGDKSVSSTDIPNMGSMKTYLDKTAKKTIVVQEAQKMGTELNEAQMEAALGGRHFSEPKPTGKKETIKGYAAEEFISMLDTSIEFDIWAAKDMPKDIAKAINSSMESSMQLGGMKNEAFKALYDKGYAPIRIEVKKDGDIQATMEFAKVEPKKLDDKIFVIASDIKISKMDEMMEQHQPPMKDGSVGGESKEMKVSPAPAPAPPQQEKKN